MLILSNKITGGFLDICCTRNSVYKTNCIINHVVTSHHIQCKYLCAASIYFGIKSNNLRHIFALIRSIGKTDLQAEEDAINEAEHQRQEWGANGRPISLNAFWKRIRGYAGRTDGEDRRKRSRRAEGVEEDIDDADV